MVFGLANASYAYGQEACPIGQEREILEKVVQPAKFFDILQDSVEVITGDELVTIPAVWEWIDRPDGYIAPQTVTYENLFINAPVRQLVEYEFVFQEKSFDYIEKLDGRVEARMVPALTKKEMRDVIINSGGYYFVEVETPYDKAVMEKGTKIKVVTKGALTFSNATEYLPLIARDYLGQNKDISLRNPRGHKIYKYLQEPNVVGRIRRSARLKTAFW